MDTFSVINQNHSLIVAMVRKTVIGIARHDQDDLVQDIIVGLAGGKLGQYDPARGCSVSSFIGTVARSMSFDWARAQRYRRVASLGHDSEGDEYSPPELADPACETPETILISAQERASLKLALESLGPNWREFASALIADDFNASACADRLGVSVNTIYSRTNKLRRKLADLML